MTSFLISLFAASISFAADNASAKWGPMPMDEIRSVYENKQLADEAIVQKLAQHLDQRISMANVQTTRHRPAPGMEYATLLRMIAERPYPAEPRQRPEAVRKGLSSLEESDIKNKGEVRKYLQIALAMAGEPPSSEVVQVLAQEDTPKEVVAAVLNRYAEGATPIAILPILVGRATDSWNYIRTEGIGPQKPRRVFPIRESVKRNLEGLGIEVKERRELDQIPDKEGKKFETIHLDIDRKSLVNRLREEAKSRDSEKRKRAIEAARRIGGSDMKAVIEDAIRGEGR